MTCSCAGDVVTRVWEGWPLTVWGIRLRILRRVHTGTCPLADETLSAMVDLTGRTIMDELR
jgi:hypothetical protein